MGSVVWLSLAVSILINTLLFGVAFAKRSDKLTDSSYALSFLSLNVLALWYAASFNPYAYVLFTMVTIWSVRIGVFLLARVLKVGKDARFDDMRSDFWKFGRFWLGQAVVAFVLMVPVTLAQRDGGSFSVVVWLGLLVWAIGQAIEATADLQKRAFSDVAANKGKWIHTGLWQYARHPNYFGEMLVWAGIYLYCFPALSGAERLVGLVSPVLIIVILRYVSGVPILERSADARWGKQTAYQEYKARTNLLIPLPKSK